MTVIRGLRRIDSPRQTYADGERDMCALQVALRDGTVRIDDRGQLVWGDVSKIEGGIDGS